MLQINEQRFLQNLTEQAQFGRLPADQGGGIDRRSFSVEDRAVRDFFSQQAKAASLEVLTDAAANLSARLPGNHAGASTLLMGSHLDSVPNGGAYDGALGVWAALEVLSTLAENKVVLPIHLEAIVFTDEEGRLGDLFGSRALVGDLTAEMIEVFLSKAALFPEDLSTMREMVPGSLTTEAVISAQRDSQLIAGYLELHIEQGPRLEHEGIHIGVVDSIFGRRSFHLQFLGRSDHAGTTPLSLRADSLLAAAQFITQSSQIVQEQFPNCVLTCGNVTVNPGVYNVVPAETTVWVEFRAAKDDHLEQIEQRLYQLAEEITASPDLSFMIGQKDGQLPADMDDSIQKMILQTSEKLGYPSMTLSSGALHDAALLTSITPTGMIFIPSKGGRSHSPDEDTAVQDLVAGANVLLHTALMVAERFR